VIQDQSIPIRLQALALEMKSLGICMISTGCPEIHRHGQELIGASDLAESWVDEIRNAWLLNYLDLDSPDKNKNGDR
jgi:hypothetical protein